MFNVVRNELLDEDFDLATFYDAFVRPMLTSSPFVDLGFDYYGFVKPLSQWPVTNFGDLGSLPDYSSNKMSSFPSKVLLLSGTADPFHTVTSTQKALGDLLSYSVNASLQKQAPVPVYAVSVRDCTLSSVIFCNIWPGTERGELGLLLLRILHKLVPDECAA